MIVERDFLDHWKTRLLVAALGDDEMAPLYVIRLWAHCENRKADAFDNLSTTAIKAICRYAGDAGLLNDALIEAGFLGRDGDKVVVTGYRERNAKWLQNVERGKKGGRPKKHEEQTETKPDGNRNETGEEPDANRTEKRNETSRVEKSRVEKSKPSPPTPSEPERPALECEEEEENLWGMIRGELIEHGVVLPDRCLEAARSHGCTPEFVHSVIAYYAERPGAWQPGALFERIRTLFPAQKNPNELWPAESAQWQAKQKQAEKLAKEKAAAEKRQEAESAHEKTRLTERELEAKYGQEIDRLTPAECKELIQARDGPTSFALKFLPKRGEKPSGLLRIELLNIFQNREAATLFSAGA